jgi:molybdenum cofactor synthesis domain-containing protein
MTGKPPRRRFGRDFEVSALVITASDRSAAGSRADTSGEGVADRLSDAGFRVERTVVPDDQPLLEAAIREGAAQHRLVITTGGTGLTPRDVTPQATLAVIDYQVPGIAEAMRAAGRSITPLAELSRAVAGVRSGALVINLPGSPKAAIESLEAIVGIIPHALETLAGPFDHATRAVAQLGAASGAPAQGEGEEGA